MMQYEVVKIREFGGIEITYANGRKESMNNDDLITAMQAVMNAYAEQGWKVTDTLWNGTVVVIITFEKQV